MNARQPEFRNHLLRRLSPDDLGLLSRFLRSVRLPLRMVLEVPNQPIDYICFPESGFVSIVARNSRDDRIEAGLVGFEGMTGLSVLLGDDRSPHETYVQMAGAGYLMAAGDLRTVMAASATLHASLLAFVQTFMLQTAHTALANGRGRIEERLARWLLMAHDRSAGPDMILTHEFLSLMLGVRRPGVTDALHRLESEGIIRARRGAITLIDRPRLEVVADGFYGTPEAAYHRLFGNPA